MKRIVAVLLLLTGIACSAPTGSSTEPVAEATDGESPSSEDTAEPAPDPVPELAAVDERLVIPGPSNIFTAGRDESILAEAEPGGGGAGTLPPGWRLPPGSDRIVTFPTVTGRVNFWTGVAEMNGPAGDADRDTDVSSWLGISGLIHHRAGSFLVGVFLSEAEPPDTPPRRLNFTKPSPTDLVAPKIAQTFFIGDGKDYRYVVPRTATRLFIGFVDGRLWQGPPGYYGNNSGKFEATVRVTKG